MQVKAFLDVTLRTNAQQYLSNVLHMNHPAIYIEIDEVDVKNKHLNGYVIIRDDDPEHSQNCHNIRYDIRIPLQALDFIHFLNEEATVHFVYAALDIATTYTLCDAWDALFRHFEEKLYASYDEAQDCIVVVLNNHTVKWRYSVYSTKGCHIDEHTPMPLRVV